MSILRHPEWHILAEQRFRRRGIVGTSHQTFRGEPYIVLSDRVTGQNLRLSERARELWHLIDGRRDLNEIWLRLLQRPASAPTQRELVEWIVQLVSSGMILSDHELDPKHLSDRTGKRRAGAIEQRFASPLAIKLKLFDPHPLVRATFPFVAPLFTKAGGAVVAALFLSALFMAFLYSDAFFQSADQALLSQSGLIGVALVYPVMKALHELAHCYALYRFGGKVREFGVMLLVFFPVPYVEASEATTLADKRARMLVGGAGILAEMLLASIAMILWTMMEPGLERAIVFNFVLIGSISTILFNGNPLLKFDAYFVLSDWLEMPNLATRSGEFLQDRFLSRVIGLRREVETGPGEAPILATYGILSLCYRLVLTFTIALIVSGWFFVFGLLLAAWAIVMSLVWPLVKLVRRGRQMAERQNRERRALMRGAVFFALVAGLLAVPLPFAAPGQGRVSVLPTAEISAQTSGFVTPASFADGDSVEAGVVMLELENPVQTARMRGLRNNLAFLEAQLGRSGLSVQERQRLEGALEVARERMADAEKQEAALSVPAPLSGRVRWEGARHPVPGRFVFRGDRLGVVVNRDALEIVAAFSADYAGLVAPGDRLVVLLPDGEELSLPILRSRIVDVGQQAPAELMRSEGGPIPEQPDAPGLALDARFLAWAAPERDLTRWAGAFVDARIELGRASGFRQLQFHLQRLFLRVTRL